MKKRECERLGGALEKSPEHLSLVLPVSLDSFLPDARGAGPLKPLPFVVRAQRKKKKEKQREGVLIKADGV